MNVSRRITLAVLLAALFSLAVSAPGGATTHVFDVVMVEGSINLGDTMFETPGFIMEECPGGTWVRGTIDDTTGTVAGTYDVTFPFQSPLDDEHYVAEVTGTSTTHGTYNSGTGEISNLMFGDNTFTISELDTETCEPLEQVCVGTSSFTFSGGLHNGATLPLGTGEQIYLVGHGSILSVPFSTCGFIWWIFLNGADLSLTENTSIGTSPGAIFEQV